MLIVFDDMMADMESNKRLSHIATGLFLKERKFNISLVFISQSYFKVLKIIRLNSTKIPNKRELQQIASNNLCGINFKDLMKFYKEHTHFQWPIKLYDQIIHYDLVRPSYKISISEKIKTIDNWIEQNKAQCNLDR